MNTENTDSYGSIRKKSVFIRGVAFFLRGPRNATRLPLSHSKTLSLAAHAHGISVATCFALLLLREKVRSVMEVKLFRSFLLCLSVMAVATLAYGQAATGRLSGTVSGPDGLIANATVVVTG